MAKYSIPDIYKDGFKALVNLDITDINLIAKQMLTFKVGGEPKAFTEHLKELPINSIEDIADTIFSFVGLLIEDKQDIKQIASDLVIAYNSDFGSKDSELITNEGVEKLFILFENSSQLKLSYKALTLASDFKNVLKSTSILSDIRVVFNDDINDMNRHSIIYHQLKIEYSTKSERVTEYFALDLKDLENLKNQVDRALLKQQLLTQDYKEALNIIQIS